MKKVWLGFLAGFCFLSFLIPDVFGRDLASERTDRRFAPSPSYAEPQHRVHRRGNVNFCISNWGLLGSQNRGLDESPGCLFCDEPGGSAAAPSFEFPSDSDFEYLYQGALWVGGVVEGETLVSVGADGWWWIYEFTPASEITEQEWIGDQECLTIFADTVVPPALTQWPVTSDWDKREHKPLNIEVIQRSYCWQSPPFDDFVILDYTVRNVGYELISEAYLGFLLDTDIFWYTENPFYGASPSCFG